MDDMQIILAAYQVLGRMKATLDVHSQQIVKVFEAHRALEAMILGDRPEGFNVRGKGADQIGKRIPSGEKLQRIIDETPMEEDDDK